jgi:hypothetical protein
MLMVGPKVIPWGMNTHGGAFGSGVRQALMASKITGVYSTNGAYGVVATQGGVYGAVIVWGRLWPWRTRARFADPPELAGYLSRDVVELYSIKRYPFYQVPPPTPLTMTHRFCSTA